jgi:hypothetical protein
VASGAVAQIMDDSGAFLGSAVASGHFAVQRPPGSQKFVVWSEGTDVLLADLAPDRIYFVEVDPAFGAFRANFRFKASHRGTDIFPFKPEYLEGTTRYLVDATQAEVATRDEADDRKEHLKQVAQAERDMNPAERTEHTLVRDDGHTAIGVLAVAAPPQLEPMSAPPPPPSASPVASNASPAPAARPTAAAEGARGYPKGTMLKVKMKNGNTCFGEVVVETSQGVLLFTGAQSQLVPYGEILSADVLTTKE